MIYSQPTNIPDSVVKDVTPTNIRITPVNITVPKVIPVRDDKVTLVRK